MQQQKQTRQHPLLILMALLSLVVSSLITSAQSWAQANPKILMVLSGNGEQQGQTKPGYEFDEFAKAYLVFQHNGIAVDIASPQGGEVEADQYDPSKPYNAQILANTDIMAKLTHTLPFSQLSATDYDGVFVVGGKGAMFDLPTNTHLQTLIAEIYEQQGVVAAVCHGPAALVNVKLSDGQYLVAGKMVNGFTNQEEQLFGKKWINSFDFLLEDKLIARGGQFQSSDIMLSHVAIDEHLITGQNPSSTVAVATALVSELGRTPKPMPAYQDDRTLAFVAHILAGEAVDLKGAHPNVNMPLVGMYGYYYHMTATSADELNHALQLMQMAREEINNPRLDLQIAKTYQQLGNTTAATNVLEAILEHKPDFQPASDMLKTLTQ